MCVCVKITNLMAPRSRRRQALSNSERQRRFRRKQKGIVLRQEVTPTLRYQITARTWVAQIPRNLKQSKFIKVASEFRMSAQDLTPNYFPGEAPLTVDANSLPGHKQFSHLLSVYLAKLMSVSPQSIFFGDAFNGAESPQIVSHERFHPETKDNKLRGFHQDEESRTTNKSQVFAVSLVLSTKKSCFELTNALDAIALKDENYRLQTQTFQGRVGQLIVFQGRYMHRGRILEEGGHRKIYATSFRLNDTEDAKNHRRRLYLSEQEKTPKKN